LEKGFKIEFEDSEEEANYYKDLLEQSGEEESESESEDETALE
jgi:hypothetical protein